MHEFHQIALYLHPTLDVEHLTEIVQDPDGSERWGAWNLPGVQPSAERMAEVREAALTRYASQQEMDDIGKELAERYTLHARALALGKPQVAREIEEEATSLLAYFQEVRDAATGSS